jgi:hypothetical protein
MYPHGTLTLDATHQNPYWGGGLLCRSWLPKHVLEVQGGPINLNDMNLWDNLVSDIPMFGGWCRDENSIVFAQFVPNLIKGLHGLTDLIIAWARHRLRSAPQLIELARQSGEQPKDNN